MPPPPDPDFMAASRILNAAALLVASLVPHYCSDPQQFAANVHERLDVTTGAGNTLKTLHDLIETLKPGAADETRQAIDAVLFSLDTACDALLLVEQTTLAGNPRR